MAGVSYYSSGTASVAQGSRIVTGIGTGWKAEAGGLAAIKAGDKFGIHVGRPIIIASVDSDTQLTLADDWPGPSQTNAAYKVELTAPEVIAVEAMRRLFASLSNGNLTSLAALELDEDSIPIGLGPGVFGSISKDGLIDEVKSGAITAVPVGNYRNKLINPLFSINQRAVSGAVTLAAGAYGHDRWKAGASGCTYAFSTSNGVTTLNITAGSIQQVVEAAAFAGDAGNYVLSWVGNARGRINTGLYGVSGAVTAAIDGSTNVTVEFSAGTVSLPQLERNYVTGFSVRHPQVELVMARRYYIRMSPASTAAPLMMGSALNATQFRAVALFQQSLRATSSPTMSFSASADFQIVCAGGAFAVSSVAGGAGSADTMVVDFLTASGMTAGQGGYMRLSNASGWIAFDQEL